MAKVKKSPEERVIQQRNIVAVWWDGLMAILAVLSVAMVYWHDQGGIGSLSASDLVMIDLVVVAVFLGDWLFFLAKAKDSKRYIKRTWYDLLGMVPLAVGSAGVLRIFRLFRLFRVLRAIRVLARFLDSTAHLAKKSNLPRLAIAAATITIAGSTLVWILERDINPDLASWSEAIWWGVVTVTTVGYGDITPQGTFGRVIAGGLMLTGIGTIALLASQVSSALLTPDEDEEEEDTADGPPNIARQLTALARLHEDGRLTDAEFEAAKRLVLGGSVDEAPPAAAMQTPV